MIKYLSKNLTNYSCINKVREKYEHIKKEMDRKKRGKLRYV